MKAHVEVNQVIRLQSTDSGNRLWKVTGIHLAQAGVAESLITLQPLDVAPGSVHGKKVGECIVPIALVRSNPNVEEV